MPLCLKPQDRYKVRGVDQGFVFGSLSSGKVALVCLFTEYFDPRQNSWIDSERNQASRRLRIETLAQRLKKVVESGGRVHAFKLSQGSRGVVYCRASKVPKRGSGKCTSRSGRIVAIRGESRLFTRIRNVQVGFSSPVRRWPQQVL